MIAGGLGLANAAENLASDGGRLMIFCLQVGANMISFGRDEHV